MTIYPPSSYCGQIFLLERGSSQIYISQGINNLFNFSLGVTSKYCVLTLKVSTGLKALVEGVGICKTKQDLTSLYVDFVKSTQVVPVCT
jgi:hypothetical protein